MGLTWAGSMITEELCLLIYQLTGVFPSTTSVVRSTGSITSTSYATFVDVSSGPYILVGLRAEPTNTTAISIKTTIDGSLVVEKTGRGSSGNNYAVGLFFDDQTGGTDVAPILARTSIKIEAKRDGGSGTQLVGWTYFGYTLA